MDCARLLAKTDRLIDDLCLAVALDPNGSVGEDLRRRGTELAAQIGRPQFAMPGTAREMLDMAFQIAFCIHVGCEELLVEGRADEYRAELVRHAAQAGTLVTLTSRERTVLRQIYLEGLDRAVVAVGFGCTNERIRQIQAKALRKLRRPEGRKPLVVGNTSPRPRPRPVIGSDRFDLPEGAEEMGEQWLRAFSRRALDRVLWAQMQVEMARAHGAGVEEAERILRQFSEDRARVDARVQEILAAAS